MANIPYYQQKDIENIKKLREMMKTLPPFCTEFFRGIEPRTSTRTRIAYAYDLSVFFDFLKKSAEPAAPAAPAFPVTLAADAKGTVVAMENIPDEVFAQGILGKCCGIDPTEGKIYAPADGEITQAPDSGHALGIMTTAGVEVLIHVGVDTVEMKGDGFSPKVKEGDKVKKGDLLLEMDLDKIAAAAHPAVVITVITNTDDFKDVEVVASGVVEPGADLIKISK